MCRYIAALILIGFATFVFIGIMVGNDSIKDGSYNTYEKMILSEKQVP